MSLANGIELLASTASASQTRDAASIQKAAREFESLFLGQLLKIMRDSVQSGGLFVGTPGKEIYMEMMDQELARSLVEKGGLGLARMVEDYMNKDASSAKTSLPSAPASVKHHLPDVPAVPAPVSSPTPREPSGGVNYRITSDLGWRKDPFTGEMKYHRGVDMAAPKGTLVTSLTGGKVVFAGRQGGYGKTVVIENRQGVRTRYAHLNEINVQEGEEVSKGQTVGEVGSTGRATGPHLHVEMEKNGRLLNPLGKRYTK